jgi:hypothetical protein
VKKITGGVVDIGEQFFCGVLDTGNKFQALMVIFDWYR